MKHIMKIILLCVSSLCLLLAFPNAGRAELDVTIGLPEDRNRRMSPEEKLRDAARQCVRLCRNVQGSPRCRHAYFNYRFKPPVCRVTSHPTPKAPFTKWTRIWSRQKNRWLNVSDFRKGPVVKGPNRIGGVGYYIVKKSGSGWIKGAFKKATSSRGYDYYTRVWASNSAKTLKWKGTYWEAPTNFDLNPVFQEWKKKAIQSSRKACREPLKPGKRTGAPKIWANGPQYEIVSGPYSSSTKIPKIYGIRGVSNGKPGSRFQWVNQHSLSNKIAKDVCKKLGETYY